MVFNPVLLHIAQDASARLDKQAFVDPASAGTAATAPAATGPMLGPLPPMPAMGGAAGAPPMDPAMMAGAPPMDPTVMAGAPAPPPTDTSGALPPEVAQAIRDEVHKALAEGSGGNGGGGSKSSGGKKPDVATELFQIKKLLVKVLAALGATLEPDILLGESSSAEGGGDRGGDKPSSSEGNPSPIPPLEPIAAAPLPKSATADLKKADALTVLRWNQEALVDLIRNHAR